MPSRKEASALLIGPTGELVKYLVEEMIFASLAERGIHTLAVLPNLLTIVEACTKSLSETSNSLRWETVWEHVAGVDSLAQEEQKTDFVRLRAHSSVAMWSVLESSIEELAFNLATLFPDRLLKASGAVTEETAAAANMRGAFERWKSKIVGKGASVVDRQLTMLSELGLTCPLERRFIPTLVELSEARNIIVHHRSVIDRRFLDRCSHLNASPGDRYMIDREKFLLFYDAVTAYAGALLQACTDLVLSEAVQQS